MYLYSHHSHMSISTTDDDTADDMDPDEIDNEVVFCLCCDHVCLVIMWRIGYLKHSLLGQD